MSSFLRACVIALCLACGSSGDGPVTPTPGPSTLPAARWLAAAAYDAARGQILMFGGSAGLATATAPPTFFDETWAWRGSAWTKLAPTSSPSARDDFVMAYDSDRQRVVLYGGRGASGTTTVALADTWEWDGSTWTRVATSGPPTRSHMALGYDVQRKRIVMHGGITAAGQTMSDTWEWDGAAWAQRATTAPSGYTLPTAMVYDVDRKAVLTLVGDLNTGQTQFWQWSGTAWTNLGAGPPMSTPAPIAAVGASSVIALSQGAATPATWRWNGASWSQLQVATPTRRDGSAFAYDAARNQLVVFGGLLGSAQLNDTWTWDGTSWTKAP